MGRCLAGDGAGGNPGAGEGVGGYLGGNSDTWGGGRLETMRGAGVGLKYDAS